MNYSNKISYITSSPVMRQFIERLHLVAKFPIDVLMYGQTGSGKDYFASYLHYTSNREGQFIAINCAAIPETLAETELFGVEAGAYTGAQKRMGKIEAANQGTLYLDEIDSMPLNMQAKLLRALQERGAERIGSNRFIASNFCLIASSKIDLQQAITRGEFREDLYHRLNTAPLVLPTLKERQEDILPLFQSQAESLALEFKVEMPDITPQIQQQLINYDWPGNVRELMACTQRFVIGLPLFIAPPHLKANTAMHHMHADIHDISIEKITAQMDRSIAQKSIQNDAITLCPQTNQNMRDLADCLLQKDLTVLLKQTAEKNISLKKMLSTYEKEIIEAVLQHFKYSLKNSAAFLQLPMSTLHQKIKNHTEVAE